MAKYQNCKNNECEMKLLYIRISENFVMIGLIDIKYIK